MTSIFNFFLNRTKRNANSDLFAKSNYLNLFEKSRGSLYILCGSEIKYIDGNVWRVKRSEGSVAKTRSRYKLCRLGTD